MKTILMSLVVVCGVVFGGCDVAQPPGVQTVSATTEAPACTRTKRFVRITAGMDYFAAVGACAEIGGALGRPEGAAEQTEFARVCREGLYDARCWSAYTTADAAIASYNADVLGVPVCEVWR